jgi:hypothetical protein
MKAKQSANITEVSDPARFRNDAKTAKKTHPDRHNAGSESIATVVVR